MQYLILTIFLLFQLHFALQALHRGYALPWVALIFFLPLLGPAVFWFVEISMYLYQEQHKLLLHFRPKVTLRQELTLLQQQVLHQPTIENQHLLAKIYQRMEQYTEAIFLLENLLSHRFYATDPLLLFEKAKAHFALGDFTQVKQTLDFLWDENPKFNCAKVNLLYARTLSELGAWQQANHQFELLESEFHGLEASFYYLQHLQKLNNPRAHEVLSNMRYRFSRLPEHYRPSQKAWLKQAETTINMH